MKLTLEENKAINNKSVEAIEKANKMVQKQQKEIEELKMKLEAQTSNNLYRNLKEKSRNNLKEWTNQLESELDNYRQEYTRLHYEASTLKSQLEYNEIEHKRTVEGLKLQYESEITNLQNKIDDLLMEKHHENKQEGQQLHILQKENVQLQSKIKGLSTELEELQKVKEKVGLRTDNVVRLQTKQLTEHEINIRTLESEIKSCELQKEATEKELSLCYENNKILTSELQSTKKELILIKNQLEEVKQKCQIELANIKVENLRNKGKLERDKSQLNIELSSKFFLLIFLIIIY
ncbi:centrosomal protein of 83 kDa-like [Centruroides sculpturatus]|uniref:centrosomal protein of 83 kDa-like n=1 Tax=Centruroides sculpturatus TaxID=218467 RepID=UPI000C6D6926|nr:centrosomal protein of 83 kDa-like [Centruroides sculpturatus]